MTKIEIIGLKKQLNGDTILDDVNLTLTSGKIYGIRGKNGCGKTMLLRSICGFILPTEGEIRINDKVLHKDISIPESIGALIENPSFLGEYSGKQNLEMLAKLAGKYDPDAIMHALEQVALVEDCDKKYGRYSLGMRQKLGIANAILNEPDIIILDEPINALDEDSVFHVRDSLFSLRDKGKLIIIACHDRDELDILSDEIFLMSHGKMI